MGRPSPARTPLTPTDPDDMQRLRRPRPSAALPLVLLLGSLGACASVSADRPAGESKSSPAKAADEAAKKERKLDELRFELEGARVALQVAELEAAADALGAAEDLEDARRELEEAERALKRFSEVKMPHSIAEGQLGIERSMQRLSESRQELAQMEAMYAADPNLDATGQATRDMVLERHRKQVEFSERGLDLARAEYADEVGAELPLEQRKLEVELAEARRALRKAETAAKKQALEGARDLAEARRGVSEAERELAEAEKGEGDGDGAEG